MEWRVVVTKHIVDHNHELSERQYEQYCENRRVKDPSLLLEAERLWRGGFSRRKVYEYLKENGASAIIMKDVHNLVQRWQAQSSEESKTEGGKDKENTHTHPDVVASVIYTPTTSTHHQTTE